MDHGNDLIKWKFSFSSLQVSWNKQVSKNEITWAYKTGCLPLTNYTARFQFSYLFVFINRDGRKKSERQKWKKKKKKREKVTEQHLLFNERKEAITSGIHGNQAAHKLFNGWKTAFAFEDVFPKYDASV